MKKIVYLLFVSVLILTGCLDDAELSDSEDDLAVSELPGYVAFNAPGVNVTIDDITATEGEEIELNVEVPTGNLSDVTVNFTFGGTAVYGVDFSVAGASSAGGSFIIEHTQSAATDDYTFADNGDIEVDLLKDDDVDGEKTLTVTLVSASNAEGELAVGRGGTDLLRTSVVIIADIDCPLDLDKIVGDWNLELGDKFGDGWNGASITIEIDGVGTDYTIDDGFSADFIISVPAGTTTIRLIFNSGDWDGEVEWTFIAPNGETASQWLGCDSEDCPPDPGEARLDTCLIAI